MRFALVNKLSLCNVTLGGFKMFEGKKYPCPICFDTLYVRKTKKKKPYCVCDICGLQLFIRGKEGIKTFIKILNAMDEELISLPNKVPFGKSAKAISIANRLLVLKSNLGEIRWNKGIFDNDLTKAEKIIKLEIEELRKELDNIIKNSKNK